MPLPDLVVSISSIAVIGTPIDEGDFPTDRSRRIPANLAPEDEFILYVAAEEITDFSVDCTLAFEDGEAILAAYAWTDDTLMEVTTCRFADRGVYANVSGGVDGTSVVLSLHAQTNLQRAYQWKVTLDVTGTSTAVVSPPADTSYPKNSYLADVMGTIFEPMYADVNNVLISA